jgi:hypothetical protein
MLKVRREDCGSNVVPPFRHTEQTVYIEFVPAGLVQEEAIYAAPLALTIEGPFFEGVLGKVSTTRLGGGVHTVI